MRSLKWHFLNVYTRLWMEMLHTLKIPLGGLGLAVTLTNVYNISETEFLHQ